MLKLFTKVESTAKGNYGAILTFALLFLCSATQAQVGIAKTAKETLRPGEKYELKISLTEFSDFKIVTPKDGNLTLSLESYAECTFFVLFSENGISFNPTIKEIVASSRGECRPTYKGDFFGAGGSTRVSFNRDDNVQICSWNPTVEMFKGSFTFKLDEGVYYLRIARGQTGLSTVNVSIQFKDLNGNVIR